MSPLLQSILALVGVLALIFVLFFLMKRFSKRMNIADSRSMKVLERITLGPDKLIILVSLCGKCMVLGVTAHHIEKICDVDATEEEISSKTMQGMSFLESFKTVLGKKPEVNDKSETENPMGDENNDENNIQH